MCAPILFLRNKHSRDWWLFRWMFAKGKTSLCNTCVVGATECCLKVTNRITTERRSRFSFSMISCPAASGCQKFRVFFFAETESLYIRIIFHLAFILLVTLLKKKNGHSKLWHFQFGCAILTCWPVFLHSWSISILFSSPIFSDL